VDTALPKNGKKCGEAFAAEARNILGVARVTYGVCQKDLEIAMNLLVNQKAASSV
jgi:hypothetical protein